MSTALRAEPEVSAPSDAADLPSPPQVRGRRSPKWIALGVIAICLGGLGAFFLYNELSQAQTVVAVANTVYRGSVVTSSDLTSVTVGKTPGVTTVPADQLESLIGQRAVADLMAGSLLPAGAVAASTVPAADHAVVGLKLVAGRAPVGYLQPSSLIRLVAIPPEGADASYKDSYTGMIIKASVIDATPAPDGLSIMVNVDVATDKSAAAALLAARDRLVVVRDAEN